MNRILSIITVMAVALTAWAASTVEQANKAYNQELYKKALELYLAQEKTGAVSTHLYYNIGNTYYRLNDIARAIVYYERALVLDPGNGDARRNLDFVRERSGIDDRQGSNIITVAINTLMSRLSSNAWALIALGAFILALAGVAAYLWLDRVGLRKTGFFGAGAMMIVAALSLTCAIHNRNAAVLHNTAIVIAENIELSHAPRPAKDKTEVAFELGKGVKVNIIDRVNNDNRTWLRISTGDNREAWLQADDVVII